MDILLLQHRPARPCGPASVIEAASSIAGGQEVHGPESLRPAQATVQGVPDGLQHLGLAHAVEIPAQQRQGGAKILHHQHHVHGFAVAAERQPQHPVAQRLAQAADDTETDILRLQVRSEEHTSELQSLMRTSYAVISWKNKTNNTT